MKAALSLSLLLLAIAATPSRAQEASILVSGTCDQKSGVSIDDGANEHFACNIAVITRTQRGTVLIQFTDRSGDDGRILGFAGVIEGKQGFGADTTQIMAVERVYLAAGADPILTSRGTCFMNWTGLHRAGGRLKSVLCAGRGEAEGADVKAIAALTAR
jgi:hypothetical protein